MSEIPPALSAEIMFALVRPLASDLDRIVQRLGQSHEYRNESEWGRARMEALESLKSVVGEKPENIVNTLAVCLVRNLSALIMSEEIDGEEGEHFRAVLLTVLTSPSNYDSLLNKVVDNIESFSVGPGEDPEHPDGYAPTVSIAEAVKSAEAPSSLAGRTVSVTGDFAFGTRERVTARFAALGAGISEMPTGADAVLVVGSCCVMPDGTLYLSQRLRAALEHGATIVHESQVLPLLLG